MKNWFLQKTDAEQKIIVLLAGIMLWLFSYSFIYLPIDRQNHRLKTQMTDVKTDIETMHQLEQQLQALAPVHQTQAVIEDSQLIVLIQQIAEQHSLSLADIKSQTNHKILVNLTHVPFNTVIRWLDILQTQYQVIIHQFSVESEKKGLTNINVILGNHLDHD